MQDSLDWALQARTTNTILHRPVTSLRHQEGAKSFLRWAKIFWTMSNTISQGGRKIFLGLRPRWLRTCFCMIVHLGNGLFYSCSVKGYNAGLQQWRDW